METPDTPILLAETEELFVSYEVRGPADGRPVLLLHGWPDDIRTWDKVAAALASGGYRTIAPYLRGFGPTRFRKESTPRTGQPVALARDAVQFLDALGIERAIVIGHDWGGRIGYILGALWPERVERLVALSVGYETNVKPGSQVDYQQQQHYWYQWFMGSERGREALQDNARGYCRYLWQSWSPTWRFTEAEFAATAPSWDNPDWAEVTLHSYRVRWGNAATDPRFAEWEDRLKKHPLVNVPTVLLHGGSDTCSLPASTEAQAASFAGSYERRVLPGVGHFVAREAPDLVSNLLLPP